MLRSAFLLKVPPNRQMPTRMQERSEKTRLGVCEKHEYNR